MNDIAMKQTRQVIETTYDCTCDIIEHRAVKDEITKRTNYTEEKVIENQKCRLSFETIKDTDESETSNNVIQIVKLFIAPEIKIKPRFENRSYRCFKKYSYV